MSNYEIMLILDPKSDEKIISEIANSTFSSKDAKIQKMERTELAYEINKSKTAMYFLVNVSASGEEINEFTRKANISKSIWRILSINLDSEKGLNRKAKPKKVRKPFAPKKTNPDKISEVSTVEINAKALEKSSKETKAKTTKKSTTKKTTTKKEKDK